MGVKAIIYKKRGDACALVDLIIYNKLGKRQVVNLVILCETNKSTEVFIHGNINNFGLAVYF